MSAIVIKKYSTSTTSPGTSNGYVEVDSNSPFYYVGAVITIVNDDQSNSSQGEITDLSGSTLIGIRLDNETNPGYGRSDMSGYDTGATLTILNQATNVDSDRVERIIAGENVIITPRNGRGVVTIGATGGGGGGGAPTNAKYILQQANGSLSSAQSIGALATGGLLKFTTGTGVLARAVPNTDYQTPLEADVDYATPGGVVTYVGTALTDYVTNTALGTALADYVPTTRTISTNGGLQGGGNLTANRTLSIATNGVTVGLMAQLAGLSILGNSTNSLGDVAAITGTDGQILRVSGTALGFGTIATAGIADAAVTFAKFQNSASAGLSVIGRSTNSAGAFAEIATTTSGHVLRLSGTTLGFGTLLAASFADGTIAGSRLTGFADTRMVYGDGVGLITISEFTYTQSSRKLLINSSAGATYSGVSSSATSGPRFEMAATAGSNRIVNIEMHGTTIGTNYAGISRNSMFAISDDASVTVPSGFMLHAKGATPMYFATNNVVRLLFQTNGNWAFGPTISGNADATTFGSGVGVGFIANVTTPPATNPTGGSLTFSRTGNCAWLGTAGPIQVFGGIIKTIQSSTGNVGIGEDDLHSYTIPAGTLANDGDAIEAKFVITFAANANLKQVRLKYGGTTIYDSTAQLQNGGSMIVQCRIVRTGATTQRAIAWVVSGAGTPLFLNTSSYTTPAETLSGTVVLKATGEAVADNDTVSVMTQIFLAPALN